MVHLWHAGHRLATPGLGGTKHEYFWMDYRNTDGEDETQIDDVPSNTNQVEHNKLFPLCINKHSRL